MDIQKLDLTLNELSDHSPNILRLIEDKGMKGYDVYIALHEYLTTSKESELSRITVSSLFWIIDIDCSDQFYEDVILNYDLFKLTNYTFTYKTT